MRVLVTGDRFLDDPMVVNIFLSGLLVECGLPFVVVEGQCPKGGADRFAELWAKSVHSRAFGVEHLPFPADWKRFGRAAGPIRNRQMLREGVPDMVVAFHDRFESSSGTKDMVEVAVAAGVPVYHVRRVDPGKLF